MLKEFDLYSRISFITVIVGGILWLFAGLADFYLVELFGTFLGRLIYIAIGAAACWLCYQIYLEKNPPSAKPPKA